MCDMQYRRSQRPYLTEKETFLDAMFEMSDIWTDNIIAEEHAAFLNHLLACVSYKVHNQFIFLVESRPVNAPMCPTSSHWDPILS